MPPGQRNREVDGSRNKPPSAISLSALASGGSVGKGKQTALASAVAALADAAARKQIKTFRGAAEVLPVL